MISSIGTRVAVMVALPTTALVLILAAVYTRSNGDVQPQVLWLLVCIPVVVAVIVWAAVRALLSRKMDDIRNALRAAAAGNWSLRLPESGGETAQLARAFNELQTQIERSFSRVHDVLEFQAMHDALTELPNRTLLMDRLGQAILVAQRGRHSLALMIADLDHFKEINDTLGHPVGDAVLQQAAVRMRRVVRDSDTVARLGGDEFAFLLPTANAVQAQRIAAKLLRAFEEPFVVDGHSLNVGASIGISVFPEHGADGPALLRRADVAMYEAKRGHRGQVVYEREYDLHSARQLAFRNELRSAIAENQLMLCFQPVLDLTSGEVSSVEALVRWRHPRRGMLYPDDFIPLAERTGLIRDLTLWVIENAAEQSQAWSSLGLELRVAVNLSAHNLHDAELPRIVDRILAGEGASQASRLRFEITETAVMPGPSLALEVLNRLSAQGVRISIDDFGTGYSSLAYLKRLPVDELKIDKSFVTGMVHDSDDAVIVRSTIDLAHNIGLRVVAEGVEDDATRKLLAAMHCDAVQGYHIGRPMEPRDLVAWLRERRSPDQPRSLPPER